VHFALVGSWIGVNAQVFPTEEKGAKAKHKGLMTRTDVQESTDCLNGVARSQIRLFILVDDVLESAAKTATKFYVGGKHKLRAKAVTVLGFADLLLGILRSRFTPLVTRFELQPPDVKNAHWPDIHLIGARCIGTVAHTHMTQQLAPQ